MRFSILGRGWDWFSADDAVDISRVVVVGRKPEKIKTPVSHCKSPDSKEF